MATTWIITTNPSRPVAHTAQAIRQTGCKIQNVLEEMGVIVAVCDDATIARVRTLPGVADVAEDTPVSTQGR